MSEERRNGYNRDPVYWDNAKLDDLTSRLIERELAKRKAPREKSALATESIRVALESETGLTGLTTIDDSIRRVAIFDGDVGGVSGLKPEILKKLQRPSDP